MVVAKFLSKSGIRFGISRVTWEDLVQSGKDPIEYLEDKLEKSIHLKKDQRYQFLIWISERSYPLTEEGKEAARKDFRKDPYAVAVIEALPLRG